MVAVKNGHVIQLRLLGLLVTRMITHELNLFLLSIPLKLYHMKQPYIGKQLFPLGVVTELCWLLWPPEWRSGLRHCSGVTTDPGSFPGCRAKHNWSSIVRGRRGFVQRGRP